MPQAMMSRTPRVASALLLLLAAPPPGEGAFRASPPVPTSDGGGGGVGVGVGVAFVPAVGTAGRSRGGGRRCVVAPPAVLAAASGQPAGVRSPASTRPSGAGKGKGKDEEAAAGFIDSELRGAAMRLHTRAQSPKEGEAAPTPAETAPEPYVPTRDDYLSFLVDSQRVYQEFEDVVRQLPEMEPFRDTGLERTEALERDIRFMCREYGLERPGVGDAGREYAEEIRRIAMEGRIPELVCHYYNFYFAHTAGGRMIGKQMASLLLDKRTLDFYKWDGDLNEIKGRVKDDIERMAATWTREEKDRCVVETAATFKGGGSINSYLTGGAGHH